MEDKRSDRCQLLIKIKKDFRDQIRKEAALRDMSLTGFVEFACYSEIVNRVYFRRFDDDKKEG